MITVKIYAEAIATARKMGSWVLYEIRDAKNIDHFAGYLAYSIEDMRIEMTRSTSPAAKRRISTSMGSWRRALSFVASMPRDVKQARKMANVLIAEIEYAPQYAQIPYYVKHSGHRTLSHAEGPGRPQRRPAINVIDGMKYTNCPSCAGMGLIRTTDPYEDSGGAKWLRK